jgi:hypothetical protein
VSRNFQVFDPLDFLAEVTQHIPNKGGTHDKILRLVQQQVTRNEGEACGNGEEYRDRRGS